MSNGCKSTADRAYCLQADECNQENVVPRSCPSAELLRAAPANDKNTQSWLHGGRDCQAVPKDRQRIQLWKREVAIPRMELPRGLTLVTV